MREKTSDDFPIDYLGESIHCIFFYQNEIYVGGSFQVIIGGDTVYGCIKWDGKQWKKAFDNLPGLPNDSVNSFAIFKDKLYIGGSFINVGKDKVNGLLSWDGIKIQALDRGVITSDTNAQYLWGINSLASDSNFLYAGGFFDTAGSIEAHSIARWDGTAWSPLVGNGFNGIMPNLEYNDNMLPFGTVTGISVDGDKVYISGNFDTVAGMAATGLAVWDGNTLSPIHLSIDSHLLVAPMIAHEEIIYLQSYNSSLEFYHQPSFQAFRNGVFDIARN